MVWSHLGVLEWYSIQIKDKKRGGKNYLKIMARVSLPHVASALHIPLWWMHNWETTGFVPIKIDTHLDHFLKAYNDKNQAIPYSNPNEGLITQPSINYISIVHAKYNLSPPPSPPTKCFWLSLLSPYPISKSL